MFEHFLEELKRDPNVRGILLTGSRARGDSLPGSDIDLLVLVNAKPEQTFGAETLGGVLVERHVRAVEGARASLSERPMELYSYLDGHTLYDPDVRLAELIEAARNRFEHYCTPPKEKQAVFYWLQSAHLKLRAAWAADDFVKLGYYSSVNSWEVLEGLWALNDKPVPPAGAVWAHLPDLTIRPEGLEASLKQMFAGTAEERAGTMLELIGWLLEHLTATPLRP